MAPNLELDIPPEISLHILRILSFSNYCNTLGFKRKSDEFSIDSIRNLIKAQQDVYRCTLVCRDWYEVGLELLYMCPCITSIPQLQSYASTLQKKPDFLPLVKSVVVEEAHIKYSLDGLELRHHNLIREKIAFILTACSSLTEVVVFVTEERYGYPVAREAPTFLATPYITSHIQRVHFFGSGAYDLAPHHTFLALEVLVISTCVVDYPFAFPNAPNLHTIQIVKTFCQRRTMHEVQDPSVIGDCPSLRTLELYLNTPSNVMEFLVLKRPQLERLHLIGHAETRHFRAWSVTNVLDKLCHLVIGRMADGAHPVQDWIFPSTLKDLTCFVYIPPSTVNGPLHCLLRTFQLNAKKSPRHTPPRLILYIDPRSTVHEWILDQIRDLGVTIERRETRE